MQISKAYSQLVLSGEAADVTDGGALVLPLHLTLMAL